MESEIKANNKLKRYDVKNTTYDKFERDLKNFSQVLNGLMLMKKRLLFECSLISDKFIEYSRKKNLEKIIQKIGVCYNLNLQKLVISY